jgi:seryl-tRNA synthetase
MAGTGPAMTGEAVMHDIKWIRENPEAFDKALGRRGLAPESARLMAIDERRRAAIAKFEQAQARRNAASKEIGEAKKKKDDARAQALMAEVGELKNAIPALEANEKEALSDLDATLAQIPNLPLDDVPDGADEHGNVEHHRFGARRDYAFAPRQHFELGEALGQMDFETAAKLSGARFVVLKKGLARLERALGQFMLDLHTNEHGYTEVAPPLLVRDEAMFGTAQLPKFKDDQFQTALIRERPPDPSFRKKIETSISQRIGPIFEERQSAGPHSSVTFFWSPSSVSANFVSTATTIARVVLDDDDRNDRRWLIPTAEVPLTNLVRDSTVEEAALPLRLAALTPCFRQEAGAAGKDTRGMIRQHQFTKVELVSITTPEASRDEHERMLSCAEEVLRRLDLHYRVVTLCAGDMGFAAHKTYDIEVWLPGQSLFREISSCSVCGAFQARRMAARYRTKEGRQVRHVHTLNGSGVAVGRALIAVMETYQQADGSIAVPDVLQTYMGGMKVIAAK